MPTVSAWVRIAASLVLALLLSGCAGIASRAGASLGRDLSAGILNQDDPETVAAGLPAYLVLLDGLLDGNPDDPALLLSAGKLYGAYAGSFAEDPARKQRLAARADGYVRRATCARDRALCAVLDQPHDAFAAVVAKDTDTELLHALAATWITLLQARPEDFELIARLPAIQTLFERVEALDPAYDGGSALMYLGVLDCLRSESLGGNPQRGIGRLDQSVQRTQGRSLMPKVLEAEFCARLVFDQALHDRLLDEVLQADARAPGLTLMNTLAQRRAGALRASGKAYFE